MDIYGNIEACRLNSCRKKKKRETISAKTNAFHGQITRTGDSQTQILEVNITTTVSKQSQKKGILK